MHDAGFLAIGLAASLLSAFMVFVRGASKRGQRELEVVLTAASLEAVLRENELVTVEHVMLAMSFDPTIEDRLEKSGIDAAKLREALEESLGPVKITIEGPVAHPVRLDGRMATLMGYARLGKGAPTVLHLFAAIRDVEGPTSLARDLLRAPPMRGTRGTDRDDSQVESSPYRSAPSAGDSQVRFWNDARTTMPHVISSLVATCGLEGSRARYLMLRVHRMGSAVVGVWPEAEARAIVDRVTAHARKAGFALRVTVEPRGTTPPGLIARALGR